ncbi:MAG TPA: hypothetical protein VH501_06810 [Solirubrobacterales bacterium]|jgi:hypothetical protein
MPSTKKYDWPDDNELQALLDEHGTVETARHVGCPPASLSRRIRRRGLRGPNQRRGPDTANGNGKPDAPNGIGEPQAASSNGKRNGSERESNEEPPEKPDRYAALSAFARRAPSPGHALALLRRLPSPIRRALAVVGLAAVAAIAAFISVSNDPKTFQRESSFAVRPSPDVPPASVNDVLGTLAQPDSAVTETIVNMLGSPRLSDFAARAAGVPTSAVGGSGTEYTWSATRRTGSTIVDVRLKGPDDQKLLAMQSAAAPEAARLVEDSYPPYRLETLSAPSPPTQVGPKTARTVGLALLLGALLGITLVLAERRLRSGPVRGVAERGEPWGH